MWFLKLILIAGSEEEFILMTFSILLKKKNVSVNVTSYGLFISNVLHMLESDQYFPSNP